MKNEDLLKEVVPTESELKEIIVDYADSNIWKNNDKLNHNNNEIEYDYIIEKNSYIQPNLRHLLWNGNDKQFSKKLNLNNWLQIDETNDNSGNYKRSKYKFVNNKKSISFGIGKRNCLGIALAMKEIECFLANLILNYKVLLPWALNIDESNFEINFTSSKPVACVDPPLPVKIEKRTTVPLSRNCNGNCNVNK